MKKLLECQGHLADAADLLDRSGANSIELNIYADLMRVKRKVDARIANLKQIAADSPANEAEEKDESGNLKPKAAKPKK